MLGPYRPSIETEAGARPPAAADWTLLAQTRTGAGGLEQLPIEVQANEKGII